MAAKKSKAKSASKPSKAPEGVTQEIAAALGDNAPDAKKHKGNAYLKELVFAVADEDKFTDKQFEALSKKAKAWLQEAEAVLQKDDAELPDPDKKPVAAAEEDDAGDDDDDSEDGEDSDDDGEDSEDDSDDGEEEEEAKPKKAKGKAKPAAKKKKEKAEPKAAKKKPTKEAKAAKPSAAKPSKSAAEIKTAVEFAKKLSEEGPCAQIRKVTEKYKAFERADVLAVADALKINRYTASRQFQVARAGGK